ncbi:MAG: nucleoside triphosphate pyrophosphohydrolase [Spirochaetaceae bacterium]|nr:nucleoside triphosphate pyrophosphohydrolase [Spirochaetaceae bacterium]
MEAFEKLYTIITRLRGPGGCPWDREQTPQSLRGGLIEETYECVEAIDEGNPEHIKEELGDLFLLGGMLSYMHEEAGLFSVEDVLSGVAEKLIRRHPHVFGGVTVKDSAEVLDNWAKIKVEQEGRTAKKGLLDEVSRSLPPMDRAYGLQKKAAKVGFDWTSAAEVFGKVEEELGEVREAMASLEAPGPGDRSALEGELGDVLFAAVNLCRFLGVEPSVALQRTNRKFAERFRYVEQKMQETGCPMQKENLAVMDGFWEEAKSSSVF